MFNLPAATLQAGQGLRIKVPDGSTTLINVRGGSFQNTFEGGIFMWDEATGYVQLNVTAPNADLEARRKATLWNFPEASSVTLGPPGTAWQGSVLAPRASVQLTYQHIHGSIAAASMSGTGEIGYNPPTPCLPDPTPCPQPSPTPTTTPTLDRPTPTHDADADGTDADHDADGDPDRLADAVASHPRRPRRPRPRRPARPRPTPLPTVSPAPIVTPTRRPTPRSERAAGPGRDAGEVVVEGGSAEVDICKKVMTPKGRAVEERHVRAGQIVKFRMRVTNLGTDVARNVRVCDIVPRGLTFVRATVKVTYRNGRPCVTIPLLTGQREGFVWMRVTRTARGTITNVAAVTSRDGGTPPQPGDRRSWCPPRRRRRRDGLGARGGCADLAQCRL